jgi:hypothetical protein
VGAHTQLAERLWRISLGQASFFLQHYNAKTVTIDLGLFYPTCHNGILYLVSFLKSNGDMTLKDLNVELLSAVPRAQWLVLLFAGSVWLMLSTSNWLDESLLFYVQRIQSQILSSVVLIPNALELRVSARGLNQIAGIDLVWTSDLTEHLNYDASQGTLSLFRHASFLKDRPGSGYTKEYLRETASALASFFHTGNRLIEDGIGGFAKRQSLMLKLVYLLPFQEIRKITSFWSNHFEIIHNAFQRSKPSSPRQWFHDNRDGSQYYASFFAAAAIILTLLFGLIQSVTGILQVIKK